MNRDVTIILGKTGYGKSWWGKLYIKKFSRRFVFDPATSKEYEAFYDLGATHCNEMLEQSDHFSNPATPFSRGIYDFNDVDIFGNLSFYFGNNLFLLEEVSMVFQKGVRVLPNWARRVIFYGRHKSCSICLIAQRASSIPIDFRSQATRIISFQQHEHDDVSWLETFYGREHCKRIALLPKFTCMDYNNGAIGSYSIVDQVSQRFGIKLDIGDMTMVEYL